MDGVHDMGGMHGFGSVPVTDDGNDFQQEWEARTYAMNLAMLGHLDLNVDRFRFLVETIPPAEYLESSYYQRWLKGLLQRVEEAGLLDFRELQAIRAGKIPEKTSGSLAGAVSAEDMRALLVHNIPMLPPRDSSPRFAVGDRVRGRKIHPRGHTRLPRYVRGRVGEIVVDLGDFTFADDNGALREAALQRVYTVRFTAAELWGTDSLDAVNVDLWESHLEQL
jgi:nitrile hydratase beta subunit